MCEAFWPVDQIHHIQGRDQCLFPSNDLLYLTLLLTVLTSKLHVRQKANPFLLQSGA